ncbi:uncharacterized protein L3040_005853 [Drepanopeziza brunnea f. sp. 'multigermtubi']|uniref:uncharacterized protein n=1 Tax=Drepanopeziza brunnea f. sp. 'multigermtubi' TaxID=698441 RepID=UPI0023822BA2|nr:hypothetical protein L3040_005853 [Drepanopeziza brunnea f. sp. 'multigermtubi']
MNFSSQEKTHSSFDLLAALSIDFEDPLALKAGFAPSPPPDQPLPPIPRKSKSLSPVVRKDQTQNPTSNPALVNHASKSSLKRPGTIRGTQPPTGAKKEVKMAPQAMPTQAQTQCLELCQKTTHCIDVVAVHILEYMTAHTKPPASFVQLSHDFLSTCEILYSLEAGLRSFNSANPKLQRLPKELLAELEMKFRVTQSDFNLIDALIQKMTRKKGMSKWGRMFGDIEGDICKVATALKRTRESLKISSMVITWNQNSSGDHSVPRQDRGFGYTGLATALDRSAVEKGQVKKDESRQNERREERREEEREELEMEAAPSILAQHALPAPLRLQKNEPQSSYPPMPSLPGPQQQSQARSLYSETSNSQTFHRPQTQSDRHTPSQAGWVGVRRTSSSVHDGSTGRVSTTHDLHHTRPPISYHSDPSHDSAYLTSSTLSSVDPFLQDERRSIADDALSMTSHTPSIFHDDMAGLELDPSKVVRYSVDPSSMPRVFPSPSSEGDNANMKEALVTAIRGRNHRIVEQLLHRGVSAAANQNRHPLIEAIFAHDEESIRLLLLVGAEANEAGRDGLTPLLACVEKSFLPGATMLLKYGANPNLSARYGENQESPLAVAVTANMANMTQLLLQYNGDANSVTSKGTPILTAAIKQKTHRKFIELLLAYGANPNAKSREGKVALFEAIMFGRADITSALLEGGADANLPGPKHMLWPSIHYPACLAALLAHGANHRHAPGIMELAVGTNNIEVVRTLLSAGVDPDTKKDGIFTPLCSSIRDDRDELVDLLLSNGADPNIPAAEYPTFTCVTQNRVHFLPALLAAGADLNKPKGILELAVSFNNLDAINWLLDNGVSPNDRNAKGKSPLTTAIRENRMELVEILLQRGADPHARGEDWPIFMAVNNPPILKLLLTVIKEPRAFKGIVERAVHADQLESIQLLLAAGVSVEDKTGGVFSPLTTAIREKHMEIVTYLIGPAGADVNAPGEHLPVVKALRTFRDGNTTVLEWLLEKGADPNKIYRSWNGVMQAVENGNEGVLRLLARTCGIDLEAKDDMGNTVLDMASSRGWEEAVQILTEGDLKGARKK